MPTNFHEEATKSYLKASNKLGNHSNYDKRFTKSMHDNSIGLLNESYNALLKYFSRVNCTDKEKKKLLKEWRNDIDIPKNIDLYLWHTAFQGQLGILIRLINT